MASFTAGTTFTDGVANDVTAAKLGALVTNATPTSGFIQDRTSETVIASNDTVLIGDASDSNNLKRMTVANFAQTLPTAKITTGTIETGTFGTTTSTAESVTTGTITTLTAGTTTSTAATITTGTIPTLVATTLITSGAGTAAAPAIVPTGDTNTGIFYPAADTAAISTQGTERLRIDSSGNVGIGTTSPSSILHISKTGAAFPSSSNPRIRLDETASGRFGVIEFDSSTNLNIWGSDIGSGSIRFFRGTGSGTESLRINQSGLLLTNGASNTYGGNGSMSLNANAGSAVDLELRVNDVNVGYIYADSTNVQVANARAGYLSLLTSNTERLRIDSSGNVGIGTTSPVYKFVVSSSGSQGIEINPTSSTLTDIYSYNRATSAYINSQINALNLIVSTGVSSSTERLRIDSSGNVLVTNAAGLGYGTGAGGTVTQGTSKTTGVTLNKPTGQITMNNAALAANASVIFTLTNSLIANTDTLSVNHSSAGGTTSAYQIVPLTCAAGSATIRVTNITAGSLSEALVINFNVIKGATS